MEIKEAFDSLKENLSRKVTNPFFGTLIVVWIIHNIKLIYIVFNFDNGTTLDNKLIRLTNYFHDNPYFLVLRECIGWTFLILFFSYVALALTRLLTNFYEDNILPNIFQITSDKNIVTREKFENLEKNFNNLSSILEKERETNTELNNQYERLKNTISAKDDTIKNRFKAMEELRAKIKTYENDYIFSEINNKYLSGSFEFSDCINLTTQTQAITLANYIINRGYSPPYLKIVKEKDFSLFLNNGFKGFDKFILDAKLIQGETVNNVDHFAITTLGYNVANYIETELANRKSTDKIREVN